MQRAEGEAGARDHLSKECKWENDGQECVHASRNSGTSKIECESIEMKEIENERETENDRHTEKGE